MSEMFQNFYDHIKTKDDGLRNYPNESKLNIELPFRMLIVGPSGSGKTNILMGLIKGIGIFDKIILLAKHLDEKLYVHLINTYRKIEKKLKINMMLAIDDIKDLPDIKTDFNVMENSLLICDDLICESKKDLAKIESFWIAGRKKGVSMCFISQGYFHIPKKIRQNSHYILIKKIDTPRDLKAILTEYSLGIEPKEIIKLYEHALAQGTPHTAFFMIDCLTNKKSLKFRSQTQPILLDD